ncbi:MAG: hypothetical protein ACYDA6_00990 [Solirubrobacteraceae bacterium]
MSAATDSRAEVAKLARLLGLDGPESLAYAQQVPASELRDYREAVTDLLYEDDQALLRRAADAGRMLPTHTLATVGERALGPRICARLTGLLAADRAAEISRHFSVEFLAQLAAELDPRRAVDVVGSLAPDRVRGIAGAMAAQGEFVAMGHFVAHLDRAALMACIDELTDDELLRVTFVLEGKERVTEVFELVGLERMQRMIDDAASMGLGEEARDLLDHLKAHQRKQLRPARRSGRR